MRPKLTSEQKEELLSLYDSTYWEPLLALLDGLCQAQERAVLQYFLKASDPNAAQELAFLKSRSEGARRLQASLTQEVTSIRDEFNSVGLVSGPSETAS